MGPRQRTSRVVGQGITVKSVFVRTTTAAVAARATGMLAELKAGKVEAQRQFLARKAAGASALPGCEQGK